MGLVCSAFFHLYNLQQINGNNKTLASTSSEKRQKIISLEKIKLDFYELLPKMDFNVSGREEIKTEVNHPVKKTVRVVPKPEKSISNSSQRYVLQVGSFERERDADAQKAKLILSGFDVRVRKVIVQRKSWYRLLLGPLDKKQLVSVKRRLKSEKIDSMVLKL
ncbi:MAG: hypothetical protein HON94_07560 [Methylococcales bacterium]|nr:hypothetical protein [Methylococcales bacterium]